jgi:raffinose/stachyose/melibiose transport system permease protein
MAARKNSRVKRVSALPVYILLTLFALLSVVPLYFSFITSLKTNPEYVDEPLALPKTFNTGNYSFVMRSGRLLRYLGNNLILITGGVILYLAVCSAAGFAFGKLKFKGRLTIFLGVLFLMIFPQMVVSAQVYKICMNLKLMNTFLGVILVWVAYFAPFGTYIMTTYFASVPKDIVESAYIDGASVFQILLKVMIPVGAPMMATITVIGFLSMWNELPFSLLLLQKPEMRTITLGIAMLKGEHGLPIPRLSAALMFSSLIPLLVFLFFQKYVAMGATAGAVKG